MGKKAARKAQIASQETYAEKAAQKLVEVED
jgi:hypothetical protein